jgi:hypothetical protein
MDSENAQPSSSRHKSNLKLKDWDEHILKFLETVREYPLISIWLTYTYQAGLHQAARGFRLDVMVMNHNSEKRLLAALEQLCAVATVSNK